MNKAWTRTVNAGVGAIVVTVRGRGATFTLVNAPLENLTVKGGPSKATVLNARQLRKAATILLEAADEIELQKITAVALSAAPIPPKCKRCDAEGVEIRGGICGNCGDDLRQEADAERG